MSMSSTPAMRRLSREPMAAAGRAGGPGDTEQRGGGAEHAGRASPPAPLLQLPSAAAPRRATTAAGAGPALCRQGALS